MRGLIALFALFAIGCGRGNFEPCGLDASSGAIQRVQALSPGEVTATTFITPVTLTAGNVAIVGVYYRLSVTNFAAVSDALGNAWTSLPAERGPCLGETAIQLWYSPIASGGANTIHIEQAITGRSSAFIAEYSGLDTVTPIELASGAFAPTLTPSASAGRVTTTQTSLLLAMYATDSAATFVVPSPWVTIGRNNSFAAVLGETIVEPGSHAPTADVQPDNGCWVGASAAFRPAS